MKSAWISSLKVFSILAFSILLTSQPTHTVAAAEGTRGGGADLKADFRNRVELLITRLEKMEDPLAREYAALFREKLALKDADGNPLLKIDVVNVLMQKKLNPVTQEPILDPQTGQPILETVPNQRPLYAYGSPLWIQLKEEQKEDPEADSWPAKLKTKSNLDVDVFHEMSWASGKSEDRDYGISVGRLKLHLDNRIQKNRHAFLKTDRYYSVPQQWGGSREFTNCVYHIETDPEALSIYITALEVSNIGFEFFRCKELYYDYGRFEYDETKDLWIKDGHSEKLTGALEILPDGNYTITSVSPDGSKNETQKMIAIDPKHPTLVEIGGRPSDSYSLVLEESRIQEAKTKAQQECKAIFRHCEFIRTYNHYAHPKRWIVVAIYEGSEPILK